MTNVPSVSRRIIYDVFGRPVRRLGFNPTSKGRKSKIELKKTA